jgi:hypothetical protein
MIEVILSDMTGVLARVFDIEDPAVALIAARTLWEDAGRDGYHGRLSLDFVVGGASLVSGVTLTQISSSLAEAVAS